MKFKKYAAILLAAVLMLSMLCGCATKDTAVDTSKTDTAAEPAADTEKTGGEKLTFAVSMPTLDNPYFVSVVNGFTDKCKELGVEVVANGCEYDSAEQFSQFENYASLGVQAVLACPVDGKSLEGAVGTLHDNGAFVCGIAQAIPSQDCGDILDDYDYGVNNGEQAVKWINTYLADEENVQVCLITLDNVEDVKRRGDGMEDTIKEKCPNAEIVMRQAAESMEQAMNIAETALQTYPDLKVIACVNDQHALGAQEAVKNLGKDSDKLYIGGGDWTEEVQVAMQDPDCLIRQSSDIQPYETAQKCAQWLYDMVVNGADGVVEQTSIKPHWQAAYAALEEN